MLFQVKRKQDQKIFNVFSVKDDKNGFPQFLIYENRAWKWQSAKQFQPIATTSPQRKQSLKG